MEKQIRVSVYVNETQYRLLRSVLALRKQSVSEWLREVMERFIDEARTRKG